MPVPQDTPRSTLGKLVPPYPLERCANTACRSVLDTADGAFLFRDLESDKLVVFCDDCARHVELNHGQRFKLVAL